MGNLNLEQILEEQNILELKKIIDQNIDMSKIKLVLYLAKIFNQKKEINIEFLKLLLQTNIDKKSATQKGFLPSHLATLFGDVKVTRTFIDNGFEMNEKAEFTRYGSFNDGSPNYDKKTTISISAFSSAFYIYNSENIKLLIENGADINEEIHRVFGDSYCGHTTALSEATEKNDINIVKLLIKKGAKDLDIKHLTKACEHNNLELVKLFIDKGVNVNPPEDGMFFISTPLIAICANKIITIDIDNTDNESEHLNTSLEIVKILLNNGADVNIGSPLMATCSQNDGIFLEGDEIFSKHRHYVQLIAIDTDVVKLLLENGANINYVDNRGKSILMEVCNQKENKFEVAKILIENGININHKDENGNTVLMLLIDVDLDKLECGFNKDKNYYQKEKAIFPSEELMQLLIDNGADINVRNNIGMTPLMKYSIENNHRLVKILLENGANINVKSEMTAYDLAGSEEIKNFIKDTKNNNPQKLVKLLSNFTIDKPIKYTTHAWDFGELKKEYGDFDGYMSAVKKQFDGMKNELEELSLNLYKKIYAFLLETDPDENYSWCSKTHINIGWSSLDGLKEWCDSGNNPFDFKLPKPIFIGRKQLATFGEVINLFKEEIEIRADFKNLEQIFLSQNIQLDLSTAKLNTRQFYTDTQKFSSALSKIFGEIKKREDFETIEVTTTELEDRSIELKITQIGSISSRSANELYDRANVAGDISEIKNALINLCDWSIESSFEDESFRVNFLHSNNVKDIEPLEIKPVGFTHILRFYK